MNQIFSVGHYQVMDSDRLNFNLLKNLLKAKFGEPYDMKGTVTVEGGPGKQTFGNGKVTFIPGTSFMAFEFKQQPGPGTQLYVGRYSQKLIDAIKAVKEKEELEQQSEVAV